ncbi:uncharacterized protein FIBRA_00194 [Fibroporia radiculosa]|uniref:Uncharacterized protein n=1 Tax=Fibroporia radiculosa TaxID=599839 RepID=J7RV49_9APHY|nr:uncharacterized protein FIBRA_00194 [Fibroporia radiculosa]CCL98200.1 predicted protein [Fibroporia radiculosa]
MMQPPADQVDDAMVTDAHGDDTQSTQATQQETQPSSQPDNTLDAHLWGYLIPCNSHLRRIDFQKVKPLYNVGRNADQRPGGNDIILPGKKISNYHCKIVWDGQENVNAAVKVTDNSSNGTFINSNKIGKGRTMLLYDGNEISFGPPHYRNADGSLEDFRFVYKHMATGETLTGLHAAYQMHYELGKGSFATVMKAMHRESGQWYAVKVLQYNKLRSVQERGNAQNAVMREINILEKLEHPNICHMKEVFFEPNTINLILEYIPGGDLLDYIIQRERLDEAETQYLSYQICDALAYIHSKDIAHRDLKPENVLLTGDIPPRVKVADFGLAKAVDHMTVLRTMCGTPCYLAPEVVLQSNNQGYEKVVDSWSTGVIIYSMLTGNNAFIENEGEELHDRVRNRRVDWPCLRQYASEMAESFLRRLLEYEATNRMTPAAAREHPWLAEEYAKAPPEVYRDRTESPEPEPARQDASMASLQPEDVVMDADAAHGDARMDEEPTDNITASQSVQIPGAYPQSQQPGNSGLKREASKLQRRADVILEKQLEQEEVVDSDSEPQQADQENLKRKAFDFEGSLTPMREADSEEEDEVPPLDAVPVHRTRRGRPASINGEGPAARAKRIKGKQLAEPPATPQGVRRSTRLHNNAPTPKVARK